MYVFLAPIIGSFDSYGLTYRVPEEMQSLVVEGGICIIEIRSKITFGVVLKKLTDDQISSEYEIKDIVSVFPLIVLPFAQRTLLLWIAEQYFTLVHASVSLFFPKNLQEKILKNSLKYTQKETGTDIPKISISLTASQEKALTKISKSVGKPLLFWGVTGSGKTSLYMHIAYKNFLSGSQTLILTPEIILGNQIASRFTQVFGKEHIYEISSVLSDARKTDVWMKTYDGTAKVIIGTRSALFYPYKNLATIIIDEEHDQSYQSDNGPRFDAREVAIKLSELTGAKIILASGTPSIKSMYTATKKEYDLVTLLEKYERE